MSKVILPETERFEANQSGRPIEDPNVSVCTGLNKEANALASTKPSVGGFLGFGKEIAPNVITDLDAVLEKRRQSGCSNYTTLHSDKRNGMSR